MSKKEQQELKDYSDDVQKVLLQFMISNSSAFVRCQNIIKPSYWTERLRPACRYILKFAEEYKVLPTPEQVYAESGVDIPKMDGIAPQHIEWFLETIEDFCKHKAMEAMIFEGPGMIAKGEYAELERRSKENMMISLQKDLGTNYFENPLERLQRMRDRTDTTSTGWRAIDDKLYGGFNRGELTFFAGGPGTGKSMFLQNLALNWVQAGLNVVFITMELSEELVGLRFDAMVTATPTKQIFKDLEEIAIRLGMIAKTARTANGGKWGKLQIKKLKMAGTTANDIRAYLQEYEIQTGLRPDAIVVDYLDLLHPNSVSIGAGDLFVKDKYTSEELRALAVEWNILAATASQLNRASIQEQDFDASHIAGGISKINTADNVMGIFTTAAMKERGEYQIQFLKTRSSSGVGSRVYMKFDSSSLRITDMPDDELPSASGGLAAITKGLQNKKVQSTIAPSAGPSLGTTMTPGQSTTSDDSTSSKVRDQAARIRNMINRSND